ncbi:unnamed protein product, partial [Ectocarpus sp. 13 AM-2016]
MTAGLNAISSGAPRVFRGRLILSTVWSDWLPGSALAYSSSPPETDRLPCATPTGFDVASRAVSPENAQRGDHGCCNEHLLLLSGTRGRTSVDCCGDGRDCAPSFHR